MPDIRRSGRGRGGRGGRAGRRGRGAIGARRSRRATSTPRFLHYRWWVLARSRHGPRVVFLFLVVIVIVAFALLRRFAPRQEEYPLNVNAGSPPSP
jgi:hypothetical protein